jgi:nucleoid-associated protein YgaU
VSKQIAAFRTLLTYNGSIHKPPLLTVVWDDQLFAGFLTQATERFTLFGRDGTPLRAKVEASFMAATNPGTAAANARTSSPDVYRVHETCAGDRLDLVADDLYGDSGYWWMLARYNRLANPRALRPGQRLAMPRLDDAHG